MEQAETGIVFRKKKVTLPPVIAPPKPGITHPVCRADRSADGVPSTQTANLIRQDELDRLINVKTLPAEDLPQLFIQNVSISTMSTEQIKKYANNLEINNPAESGPQTINDPRLGVVDYGRICPTCNQNSLGCPGHFGYTKLNVPIPNPLAMRNIIMVLKIVCNSCGKLMMLREELERAGILQLSGINRLKALENMAGSGFFCRAGARGGSHCKPNPQFQVDKSEETNKIVYTTKGKKKAGEEELKVYNIKDVEIMLDSISDDDAELMGFEKGMHPRNYIFHAIPVIPTNARQASEQDGVIWEDDISRTYKAIIKKNNQLAEPGLNELSKELFTDELYKLVKELFTSTDKNSIKTRIQGKDAYIRSSLMGKRVDFSGRTVISPDPSLKFGQVRIPIKIASVTTKPELVTAFNKNALTQLLRDGRVNHIIPGPDSSLKDLRGQRLAVTARERDSYVPEIGDKLYRWLQNGDFVIVNRQPTLSNMSFMAMEVVIGGPNTIGLHVSYTTPYNADFDGDEMNIHVPQDLMVEAELRTLLNVQQCLMSGQTNRNSMGIVYNGLTAAYMLTQPEIRVDRETFFDCITKITTKVDLSTLVARASEFQIPADSGKVLFSTLLPEDFEYRGSGGVLIKKGILIQGPITKAHIGVAGGSIVQHIWHQYGVSRAVAFLTDATYLLDHWLSVHGFSIGIMDCNPSKKNLKKLVDKEVEKAKMFVEAMGAPVNDPLEMERREKEIISNINRVPKVGSAVLKADMDKWNALSIMAEAGSKGNPTNIGQIAALVGQQFLGGKRLEAGLAYYDLDDTDTSLESRGFIQHSFLAGMTPGEFFQHMAAGREGLIDTALNTADSGSIHHRTVKALEDIVVAQDGSVRNPAGVIFQFAYGHDGLDPSKLLKVMTSQGERLTFIHLPFEILKLNEKYKSESGPRALTEAEINNICDKIFHKPGEPVSSAKTEPMRGASHTTRMIMWENARQVVRDQLVSEKIEPKAIKPLIKRIVRVYDRARIQPGYTVGILAAESLGGPVTQMALNSFHSSGSSKNVASGIDMIRALLNMSESKYPSCTIHYKNRNMTFEQVLQTRTGLVALTLDELVQNYDVEKHIDEPDKWWVDAHLELYPNKLTGVDRKWYLRLDLDVKMMVNYDIRMGDIVKQLESGGTMKVIPGPSRVGRVYILVDVRYLEAWAKTQKALTEENIALVYIDNIVLPSFAKISFKGIPGIRRLFPVNSPVWQIVDKEELTYSAQEISQAKKKHQEPMTRTWNIILNSSRIKTSGITSESLTTLCEVAGLVVKSVTAIRVVVEMPVPGEKPGLYIDKLVVGENKKKQEYENAQSKKSGLYPRYSNPILDASTYVFAETNGSNLLQVLQHKAVDTYYTYSNEIWRIYDLYGIEAARNLFIWEFKKLLDNEGQYTDPRHIVLIADFMFNQGRPNSITFRGISRQRSSVLSNMTIEQALDVIQNAAFMGKTEAVESTSATIMVGKRSLIGSGYIDVQVDPELQAEAEKIIANRIKDGNPFTATDIATAIDAIEPVVWGADAPADEWERLLGNQDTTVNAIQTTVLGAPTKVAEPSPTTVVVGKDVIPDPPMTRAPPLVAPTLVSVHKRLKIPITIDKKKETIVKLVEKEDAVPVVETIETVVKADDQSGDTEAPKKRKKVRVKEVVPEVEVEVAPAVPGRRKKLQPISVKKFVSAVSGQ